MAPPPTVCLPHPATLAITHFYCGSCSRLSTGLHYHGSGDDSVPTCPHCFHNHYIARTDLSNPYHQEILNCNACRVYEFDGFFECWACGRENVYLNFEDHINPVPVEECRWCRYPRESSWIFKWRASMLKPRPQRCAGVIQGYSGVGWQYAEGAMGQRGVLVDDAVVTEELKRRFEELEKEGEAALGYGQRW